MPQPGGATEHRHAHVRAVAFLRVLGATTFDVRTFDGHRRHLSLLGLCLPRRGPGGAVAAAYVDEWVVHHTSVSPPSFFVTGLAAAGWLRRRSVCIRVTAPDGCSLGAALVTSGHAVWESTP